MRAAFCCSNFAVAGREITVNDAAGVSLYPFTRETSAGGHYAAATTEYTGPALSLPSNNITTPIFVLVSHGAEGGGAFTLGNGSRLAATSAAGNDEKTNMGGTGTFVWETETDTSGTKHFDDVVMWRTQDQIYAETGNRTCALP
jgi:hypothetical protein